MTVSMSEVQQSITYPGHTAILEHLRKNHREIRNRLVARNLHQYPRWPKDINRAIQGCRIKDQGAACLCPLVSGQVRIQSMRAPLSRHGSNRHWGVNGQRLLATGLVTKSISIEIELFVFNVWRRPRGLSYPTSGAFFVVGPWRNRVLYPAT